MAARLFMAWVLGQDFICMRCLPVQMNNWIIRAKGTPFLTPVHTRMIYINGQAQHSQEESRLFLIFLQLYYFL